MDATTAVIVSLAVLVFASMASTLYVLWDEWRRSATTFTWRGPR